MPLLTAQQSSASNESELNQCQGEALLLTDNHGVGTTIGREVGKIGVFPSCGVVSPSVLGGFDLMSAGAIVYLPSCGADWLPDLSQAESVFNSSLGSRCHSFVLVASTAIYGASFRNPGLVGESFPTCTTEGGVSAKWKALEDLALKCWASRGGLAILRCPTLTTASHASPIRQLFSTKFAATLAGHDPSIQVLSTTDLAQAIACVLKARASGIINVAPDEAIPLKEALRKVGVRRIPLPRTALLRSFSTKGNLRASQLDYRRYTWTVSNQTMKRIGFRPQHSSAAALVELRPGPRGQNYVRKSEVIQKFDNFGMDKNYIDFYSRTLFKFLSDWYWRIEAAGMEHIPASGRGMLVGIHRGFMPWDGVMALHLIVKRTLRYPRFLIHPGLVKFPFLANFMTKLGGIIACQENAAYVLEQNELLGVFPEGIHGAFVKYSQAYQIQHFHRDAFVKMALRNRAPIIPFVTVGSAEIFPILAQVKSHLWTKYSEWPSIPITPTFPILPVPLPSKWHIRFLEPIHVERDYGHDDAADPSIVRHISREVRMKMQTAIDQMLKQRRSIFFGSIFSADGK